MERWEIVERRILVVVGIALIALAVWLATDTESALRSTAGPHHFLGLLAGIF